MGEFRNYRKYRKNVYEEFYFLHKDEFEFKLDSNDDPETNFPYHINRDADLRYLKDACVDRFDRNLRLLKRRRRKRNLKFFFIYGVPTIAILVANGFVLKQSRKQDVVPTYSLETTMISDGKMVKDNDTSKYIVTEYDLMEDDSSVIKRESTDTVIQYQVKNNTHNVIVTVGVDDVGKMSVVSSIDDNFFDCNSSIFDDVEASEIENKYQEIVEDIWEYLEADSDLDKDVKKSIKKLLEQEKTKTIITIAEFAKSGEISVIENYWDYLKRIIGVEAVIIAGAIFYSLLTYYLLKLGRENSITILADGEFLVQKDSYKNILPIKSTRDDKGMFVAAEAHRRNHIKKLVKDKLTLEWEEKFDI